MVNVLKEKVHLSNDTDLQAVSYIDPAAILEGEPKERANIFFSENGVTIGVWACEPYSEFFDTRTSWELCRVISGRCSLTDQQGTEAAFKAGDSFVVPKGFSGVFKVHEPYVMHFMTAST